ncbi:MAG: hypothetical protein KKH61_18790, partial [Gammaproteobacteria bacterium]|nr:hypothetical protein [Gammaproteobacteria bacterium]
GNQAGLSSFMRLPASGRHYRGLAVRRRASVAHRAKRREPGNARFSFVEALRSMTDQNDQLNVIDPLRPSP